MARALQTQTPEREAVVTKALFRAADLLGVTARELSDVIGLSEATLSRLKQGRAASHLSGKAYELAILFVRLYRSLDAITGGDDAVSRQWMHNRNTALDGTPLQRIRTIDGLVHVLGYLDSRRAPL
ncbi:antitoxin Xre/MbcA/ParS toxin-binding domain-containing protein [Mesorhizobium xinjiangense]|uniref:antitoxin Xre/MbcA/ParS toxin-binding domain-containing protein n=1 Tax=Mesorhizobium xinjiangense TaxID=2678685 RepID=UPI0012ED09C0|nr:antitoxin Xre/MbcA/ParS toxin-binding domain-containing protein [Mesorhizobium xinjiangense]